MVNVFPIEDEEDLNTKEPSLTDDDFSDEDDDNLSEGDDQESLADRLAALADIIPPSTRHSISSGISQTTSFFKRSSKFVGNAIWVITTSALLVALPLALALEDEAKIVAQEKEMLEQQQGAQQMLSPSAYPAPGASPNQPKALVPPGF
ncbi:mitochondrial outer membrane translocase complex, subunit Tom22 [Cyathus striatus]|nr:mitochondrial outer membrane translocase complex, subunit Tom22 [Cyathus striatus]